MAFIRTIPPAEADGRVREIYEETQGRFGYVPNWAQAFSLRPDVLDGWVALLRAVRSNLSARNYELSTLAAARALRSSYCSLAHGTVLASTVFDAPAVTAIADGAAEGPLEPRELAMMRFVEKLVHHADQITAGDVDGLRAHGYRDEEIFDLAASGAARCFFSKLLDALGVEPDSSFNDLDPSLRRALTVGRPVGDRPQARVPDAPHRPGGPA